MPLWAIAQPEDLSPEEQVLFKEIEGPQRFTSKDFHQKQDWKVEEKAAIIDTKPLKGQGHSTTDWENQDPKEWLDIDRWLANRSIKDANPDWKIRIRLNSHKELVGKVLKCVGTCQNFRGIRPVSIRHLSQIKEGDEIQTGKDSNLWIYLINGNLVRLSPETSVSFNEINLSKNEIFFELRINQGHIYWHQRVNEKIPFNAAPQTDQVSLPLMVREANIEFFERQIYQKEDELQRFISMTENGSKANEKLFEKINEYKSTHQELMNKYKTHVFVVAPNFSLDVINTSFDAVYSPNEKGYLKRRDDIVVNENLERRFNLHYRGYKNTSTEEIIDSRWVEMSSDGKSRSVLDEATPHLSIIELLTKRIFSIELASEIWLEKYSLPVLKAISNEAVLAQDHGYRLWGSELNERISFLYEYTRRVETTNLKSVDRLAKELSLKGEFKPLIIDEKFYVKALESYVRSIKQQSTQNVQQRRVMNDLQFYAWILKNDK